jgi:hypothetical protein
MTERRYTDEEVAAIFERASEMEHTPVPVATAAEGVTLKALQDIGREVGITPESIATAALSLDQVGRPTSRAFMGFPIGVGRTVEFTKPLSDSDWEHLVGDLRETFQARGRIQYDGSFRQWTNGNLQALVEPTPTGHRLRLQTVNGSSRTLMSGGLVSAGMATAGLIAEAVVRGLTDRSLAGMGFLLVIGVGIFAFGALRLPGWARLRRTQIDGVIARLSGGAESASLLPGKQD